MELIQVGEKTYYIKNACNIGVYRVDDAHVYLIDSGNDKDAGKKILKIMEEQGWVVIGIISTHSHADHIGGNKVIQDRTDCKIYAHDIERSFCNLPILEPSFLYGGYPFKKLQNKFLMAQPVMTLEVDENLPEGLEYFSLKGHSFDMIGIKTSDDVYFLADSLFSEMTIQKYHVFFVDDVREFLQTLDFLETLVGGKFICSHVGILDDISSLIELNRSKVYEILDNICFVCQRKVSFEEILKFIFDIYQLDMNENQYVLVGNTIRSYLAYLCDENKICYLFEDHQMKYKLNVV